MTRYAAQTGVSADRSRSEIERILQRYGADAFSYGWSHQAAVVTFRMAGRLVRFLLPMPDKRDRRFTHTEARGTERSDAQAFSAWEQETRQRWRALALLIKAKLEAVESGITVFEEEFLAHVLLPDGTRFGEWATPQIQQAYDNGTMPQMLLGLPEGGNSHG